MSPPDANLEKQKRRHRGPLLGIGLVAVFAIGLILYWIVEVVDRGGEPQGAEVQINGATGEPVVDDAPQIVEPVPQ